jgi:predicted RNase H-like HicB family nuclease
MRTIRVIHVGDDVSWGFTSPDVPGLFGGGETFEEAREMAEGAVRFTLETDDVTVEHYVPEPARSAA